MLSRATRTAGCSFDSFPKRTFTSDGDVESSTPCAFIIDFRKPIFPSRSSLPTMTRPEASTRTPRASWFDSSVFPPADAWITTFTQTTLGAFDARSAS